MFLSHMNCQTHISPCNPITLQTTKGTTSETKPWFLFLHKLVDGPTIITSLLGCNFESLLEAICANR